MLSRGNSRSVYGAVRTLSTSARVNASHYDVLGITPKANQRDIKSAYYKLSKMYHPDKSPDETSAKKFRAITEAYEVLGNIQLKKMYDKGLIVGKENKTRVEYKPDPEPTDPTLRFYKSRENMRVAHTMASGTPVYDFDTWSKHHYGDVFEKSQREKILIRKRKKKLEDNSNATRQEVIIYGLIGLGSLFMFLVVLGKDDYDKEIIAKHQTVEKNIAREQ